MALPQILQQLSGKSPLTQMLPLINQAKAIMNGDPQAVMRVLQQNPQVQQIIVQYGSLDGAITAICRQKGIDPQEFMNALK